MTTIYLILVFIYFKYNLTPRKLVKVVKRMLGYEDEELREIARVLKDLADYIGFSLKDTIRLLELLKRAERATISFRLGDIDVEIHRGWEGLVLRTTKKRGGITRTVEYDLTPLEAIAKVLSKLETQEVKEE